MEKLELKGTQQFLGMDIPIMEGGFGKNQRVMLAKDIAILHNVQLFNLNKLINNNINRFGLYDLIDLKTYSSEESVLIQNNLFTKAQYGNAKNIYLLSERGYTKLVSMMDNKNDKKWEVMDKLIDEYFTMRQIINSSEQMKAQLLLSIYNGGQEGVEASKKLTELEKKPLLDTIEEQKPKVEYHDSVLNPTDIKKLVTATAIAKDIGTTAKKIGRAHV